MKFSIQLSADYPDKGYGGDRVYCDMLAQAKLADRLNFDSVTITEHHFMSCLMMPAWSRLQTESDWPTVRSRAEC